MIIYKSESSESLPQISWVTPWKLIFHLHGGEKSISLIYSYTINSFFCNSYLKGLRHKFFFCSLFNTYEHFQTLKSTRQEGLAMWTRAITHSNGTISWFLSNTYLWNNLLKAGRRWSWIPFLCPNLFQVTVFKYLDYGQEAVRITVVKVGLSVVLALLKCYLPSLFCLTALNL